MNSKPSMTGMFQSSSTASGIARLQASSALAPSSASMILKSRPSRIRRATFRMTLESSTTRQVFIAPPPSQIRRRSAGHHACRSRRHRLGGGIEHIVDVENDHELTIEAMHAARDAREPRIEIDRVWLPRGLAGLHPLPDRIAPQSVGFARDV